MFDKNKINNFWKRRTLIKDPEIATHFTKNDNAINYDFDLVKEYIKSEAVCVLDLGCGTGRTTNLLEPFVGRITAVDRQKEFLEYCVKSDKVKTVCSDVESYIDNNKYDIILIFGVMNYLTEIEASQVYSNCRKMLNEDGVLIVKHGCGVEENVIVDGYSNNIKDDYNAEYRHYKKEISILNEIYSTVELVDIYPPELNRWENTHYYAFVCKQ